MTVITQAMVIAAVIIVARVAFRVFHALGAHQVMTRLTRHVVCDVRANVETVAHNIALTLVVAGRNQERTQGQCEQHSMEGR